MRSVCSTLNLVSYYCTFSLLWLIKFFVSFLLSTFVKLQELIALVELLLFIIRQESACLQAVPSRHKYVQILRLNVLYLKCAEVEKVWHEVSVGKYETLVT